MSTKESNKYSNEIQNLKIELDKKSQLQNKKIGSKKFQVKIEKDISNIL